MKLNVSRKLPEKLNRYTTLPFLIDILRNQRLTLVSPKSWEDRNDSLFLRKYRESNNLKTVLALCFSTCSETFHHWKVFSNGPAGVCIQFDPSKLLPSFQRIDGVLFQKVEYRWVKEMKGEGKPHISLWPFLKRKCFKDESEFRIIFQSKTERLKAKPFNFDLRAIKKVTLSPWLAADIGNTVIDMLEDIPGCNHITFHNSSLLEHSLWIAAIS
jgi:hypothetical protein